MSKNSTLSDTQSIESSEFIMPVEKCKQKPTLPVSNCVQSKPLLDNLRRSDALVNRAKILEAAEAVFLAEGLHASLDVVAERAGVGRATLFRNFRDRHALIIGLREQTLEVIEAEGARLEHGDPNSFGRLLRYVAELMVNRAPLTEYWQTYGQDSPVYRAGLQRFLAVFGKPLESAVAGRACRADLRTLDVLLLIRMLGGALLARTPDDREQLAQRAWSFTVEMAQLADKSPLSIVKRRSGH